jgi:hypothetical protein
MLMTLERRLDVDDLRRSAEPTRLNESDLDEVTWLGDQGRALLDAADDAINQVHSGNSSRFLAQGRQAGGQ